MQVETLWSSAWANNPNRVRHTPHTSHTSLHHHCSRGNSRGLSLNRSRCLVPASSQDANQPSNNYNGVAATGTPALPLSSRASSRQSSNEDEDEEEEEEEVSDSNDEDDTVDDREWFAYLNNNGDVKNYLDENSGTLGKAIKDALSQRDIMEKTWNDSNPAQMLSEVMAKLQDPNDKDIDHSVRAPHTHPPLPIPTTPHTHHSTQFHPQASYNVCYPSFLTG